MRTGVRVWQWGIAVVCGALLVPLSLRAQAMSSGHHMPAERPRLTVSASAEVRVAPDLAHLGIAVETRGRTSAQAAGESARIQTAVLGALRRIGVSGNQVQTRSVQVTPEYEYPREGGRPTVTGYISRNEIAVELNDLSKIGPVIDAALAQGASNVSGPRYALANPDSARREALDAAVRKAMADAQVMAAAAGVRAGHVLEMSFDGSGGGVEPAPEMVRMRLAASDAAPTPIETGLITVRAFVQLQVAIIP